MSTSEKSAKRSPASKTKAARGKSAGKPGATTRSSHAHGKAVDAPFDAALWRRASEIARQYRLTIEADPDCGYLGRSIEMPLAMGDGPTVEECVKSTLESQTLAVASMLEAGERPPAPSREGKREQQVNLRLSAEEKLTLEEASRREGYRSVSDFIRAAAMRAAS